MALDRRAFLAGLGGAILAPPAHADQGGVQSSLRPPARPAPRSGALIKGAGLGASVSYAVMDAATGAVLEARGADRLVPPASTLKSVTALYALDQLGRDRRFATRVLRAGDALVLAGGGDPVLDTDRLDDLAAATVQALAASGAGAPKRLLVWPGALPAIAEIAPGQAPHLTYNPTVSGIMLNFNRVHLDWRPSGAGLGLTLEARADRLSPRAYTIQAVAADRRAPLFDYRNDGTREYWSVARGALRRPGSRWLPVRLPALYAGDVFQTLCRAHGLALSAPELAEALPGDAVEIAQSESPELVEMMRDMMLYSTNLTAEVAGLHASGEQDLAASAGRMQGWAQAHGVAAPVHFADHSGMSAQTQVTARMMARLLAGMGRRQGLRGLMKHIPIINVAGREISSSTAIHAKTGTLNFVSNLAGYAHAPGRREIVFAIYINDMERRAASAGQELPRGVVTWTERARYLQQQLIEAWLTRYG